MFILSRSTTTLSFREQNAYHRFKRAVFCLVSCGSVHSDNRHVFNIRRLNVNHMQHHLSIRITITALLVAMLSGCGKGTEQSDSAPEPSSDQSGAASAITPSVVTDPVPQKITISRETTFVEGPLNNNGGVDFVQALNNLINPHAAPDENAAVALCQVLGSGQPDQTSHALFLQLMGVDTLPTGETAVLAGPNAPGDTFIEQQGQAMFRPWTADEFPQVAAWVERISRDLDACVLGVQRPAFYLPLIDTLPPDEALPPIMSVLMPTVQSCREVSRGLSVRAMQRIAEGDEAGTRRDILAMYRLARHLSNAPVVIQSLVGMATEAQANACVLQLLNSGLLNEESAAELLTELNSLSPFSTSSQILETGERLGALDLVQAIRNRGPQSLSFFVTLSDGPIDTSALDWNAALRTVNDWYDQIVTAVRTPEYPARIDAIAEVEQRLRTLAKGEASEIARVLSGGVTDPQTAGDQLGNLVAALTILSNTQVHVAETRREMQTRSTLLALELFRYRESHGEFPRTLSDLDVKVPLDLFVLSRLQYRRDDGSVTVYSLGPNRVDDGGPKLDGSNDDIGFVLNAKSK